MDLRLQLYSLPLRCESQFKRGSETPYTMRCVEGDPTKEKVTWSPYALINPEKNIWCQWPAFG